MSYSSRILDTFARDSRIEAGLLREALDSLDDCIQACIVDTDADLSESDLGDMVKCIRLCLQCTDVCAATRSYLGRPAEFDARVARPLLEACIALCESCGDECERHGRMHAHCRVCAEACRRCEDACRKLAATIH